MEQVRHYYLATNMWGPGRTLEPNNGWSVTAHESKAVRDRVYDELDFNSTGCEIVSRADVDKIMGTRNWEIETDVDDDGGHAVVRSWR